MPSAFDCSGCKSPDDMFLRNSVNNHQGDDDDGKRGAGFGDVHSPFALEVVERDGECRIIGTEKGQCECEFVPHRQEIENDYGCD